MLRRNGSRMLNTALSRYILKSKGEEGCTVASVTKCRFVFNKLANIRRMEQQTFKQGKKRRGRTHLWQSCCDQSNHPLTKKPEDSGYEIVGSWHSLRLTAESGSGNKAFL
ncbi:uncharacterized protein [Montipora foliosa]|uniref:uncharacterized protein isoform X3 n=1 Tax=Montipora foliosa TaxID=591990 RepID=UPI0035F1DE8B